MTSSSRTVPSARVSRRILRCGFPRLAAFQPRREHRHGFAQPARRHAGLVDAVIVARHRGRQMTLQRPRQALKQQSRYTGARVFMVG